LHIKLEKYFSQVLLHWQDVDGKDGERMKRELVNIGKNICSKGPEKKKEKE
jgi:hypothetical protein